MRLLLLLILVVLSSFDEGKKMDIVLKKNTIYVIIGSDWCSNCKRFEKQVLNDSNFYKYCEIENISIEKIDFPQRKLLPDSIAKLNASIAEKLNFDGTFPSVFWVKNDTLICPISPINYQTTELISRLNSCRK